MRVVHSGYAITTYGATRLSISDKEGKEIFTSSDRQCILKSETEKDLREYLKNFIREYEKCK